MTVDDGSDVQGSEVKEDGKITLSRLGPPQRASTPKPAEDTVSAIPDVNETIIAGNLHEEKLTLGNDAPQNAEPEHNENEEPHQGQQMKNESNEPKHEHHEVSTPVMDKGTRMKPCRQIQLTPTSDNVQHNEMYCKEWVSKVVPIDINTSLAQGDHNSV